MDKEMLAKINEVLKANGKRELSLDELDQVVGGAGFGSSMFDTHEHVDAYCEIVDQIVACCGLDVAINWVQQDMASEQVEKSMRKDGVGGLREMLHTLVDKLSESSSSGVYYGGYQ